MPGKKKKQKLKWSKLYTFSCLRAGADEPSAPGADRLLGQPGFSRVVFCNEPRLHRSKPYKYSGNYVSTTKYNVATFVPVATFEQFRRVANLYFLLAAILSLTPLAAFNRISVVAPLVFVIGISMIMEAVEDWHRFLQDRKVNSRKVLIHAGEGLFVQKSWENLAVGDVVKVSKNEYFPSDLLLLSSSYEDGLCYVETMNLDGETNLKAKRSLEATLSLDEEASFRDFKATIRCEDPNPSLYTFVGNLILGEETHSLTPAQILLRDSKLRNTEYAYGVVVFSGGDTKAVRNSTRSPSKRSRVERTMDRVIYLLFGVMVFVSLVTAVGSAVFTKKSDVERWYLRLHGGDDALFDPDRAALSGFLQFVKALMLYGYLIPISLYVSIEVVKVLQAMMINNDLAMYDEATGKAAEARTSNLNEELGQVEMILSDKTGTLTCNQMEFRKCSIEGISFGGEVTEVDLAASRRMNIDVERHRFSLDGSDSTARSVEMFDLFTADGSTEKEGLSGGGGGGKGRDSRVSVSEKERGIKGFNFRDGRLMDKMWINRSNVGEMVMFFRVMALCHTGIPVEGEAGYEAESPEEVAFLVAAREFGFRFCQRTQSAMVVEEVDPMSGVEMMREYKLLNLLEFNSLRKRMSVIVRNEDGEILLFCKGADEVIFDRLSDGGRTYQQATVMHLSNYAEDGLRTMVFAYRRVGASEYERWSGVFSKAKASVGPERDELLESASDMIERDLILLGAVAVEDKLQKGVPECIDKLAQAGLKIWLLTGDKKETAVNIGFACSLLRHDMEQLHLSTSNEARTKAKDAKEEIMIQLQRFNQLFIEEDRGEKSPFALVVDGKALELCLNTDLCEKFLSVAMSCDVVICCRVSPKQKASITRRVKEHSGKTILAIGDGANDVGMIQEADIGVGISGMEGMQAVMASDFSLPEFRFLERLLIIHGQWCYRRISKMILYFVYKNVAFGLTLFYYNVFTGFSGQEFYDDWYMVMFNVLLTSLPVVALGVLEQDVSSDVCIKFPALYKHGQQNTCFNWKRILGWITNAILTSLIVFALPISILSPSALDRRGNPADAAHLGAATYTCAIWAVNCQIALMTLHFTWISHLLIWGSILSWYAFLSLYSAAAYSGAAAHRVFPDQVGAAPLYWLATPLVAAAVLMPHFVQLAVRRSFFPADEDVIREMERAGAEAGDSAAWEREQERSKRVTQVGYSARVEAKIRHLKEQLQKKRKSFILSVTNSRQ
ncbi:P-type phospholipid transporter [Salvia divinorum]|uniref:Phospholipid-transporting ATPase n=1 Tax=Salvia divinorum TaxID=28513 RepID=A0ABD1G356_SALDI